MPAPNLRERNKQRVRRQIIDSAVTLVAKHGLDGVTADDIAAQAEVGRATFFRYFDSKEAAVVVGFYEERLQAMVAMLDQAPPKLGPLDAVIWTFDELSRNFSEQSQGRMIRLGAKLQGLSPALRAKAAEFHSRYAQAIADAIASRCNSTGEDLRPQMMAAAVLAVTNVVVEHWSAHPDSGHFPELVHAGLQQLKSGFSEPRSAKRRTA